MELLLNVEVYRNTPNMVLPAGIGLIEIVPDWETLPHPAVLTLTPAPENVWNEVRLAFAGSPQSKTPANATPNVHF
jgi:hypothetical protein